MFPCVRSASPQKARVDTDRSCVEAASCRFYTHYREAGENLTDSTVYEPVFTSGSAASMPLGRQSDRMQPLIRSRGPQHQIVPVHGADDLEANRQSRRCQAARD